MTTIEKVMIVVARETGADITEHTRLDNLGLDSLEFVSLMSALEEIAIIPDQEWVALNTVKDIADACERHL